MKNFALLLIITLFISSCSLLNDDKSEDTPTPTVKEEIPTENTNEVEDDSTEDMDENSEENEKLDSQESDNEESEISQANVDNSTEWDYSFSNTNIDWEVKSDVSWKLEDDTESEEALNEVFNEIEELFELAEQNGGQ